MTSNIVDVAGSTTSSPTGGPLDHALDIFDTSRSSNSQNLDRADGGNMHDYSTAFRGPGVGVGVGVGTILY
jgi:hypothetical protein